MFYQEDGKSKKIEISLINKSTQNKVVGHPELIRQVFMNIFDNCIKYGAFASTVEVNQWIQSGTDAAIVSIKGRSQIPLVQGEIENIFDLGFRGSNAKKIIASGTGLGLHICKQIIEKSHGGSIHVQSYGADGIEFTIKLPNGERGKP
jgi:hypothetical protein